MTPQSQHLSYADATAWRAYQGFFPERLRLDARSAPNEEQLTCGRVVLHLDRYQKPDSQLKVILLHGGGSYSRLISPYAVMINQLGYEVVVPDLPGYGLTQVARRDTTYDAWVASIRELALHEHRRDGLPLVMVGIGQGGMLALHVASHVEQVKAVAATALLEGRATETIASVSSAPSIAGPVRRAIRSLPRAADNLGVPMRMVVNTGALSNNQALVSVAQSDPQGAGSAMPISYMRSWMGYKPPVEPTAFDRPVLLTHASEDRWTPLNLSLPLFDRLTCPKRLVVLEGAGHIPVEQPGLDQYEEALGDFLNRLSAPSKRSQPLGHALARQATGEHESPVSSTRPSSATRHAAATPAAPQQAQDRGRPGAGGPARAQTAESLTAQTPAAEAQGVDADDRPDHERAWQNPDVLELEIEAELARGRDQREVEQQSTAELLSLAEAFERDIDLNAEDEIPSGITIWQNPRSDDDQGERGRMLRGVPSGGGDADTTPASGGSAA